MCTSTGNLPGTPTIPGWLPTCIQLTMLRTTSLFREELKTTVRPRNNNNNKYNKYKSNQTQPDRDNDRANTNKLSSNYKGKSKSQLAKPITDTIEYARNLPSMKQLLSAVLTENIDDFLQVHISLSQIRFPTSNQVATDLTIAGTTRTRRRARRRTDISPLLPPPPTNTCQTRGMEALAQIDTECQVGDVILRGLRGDTHLRKSDSPMWMCSGLNNQCVESINVLDIVVSFNKSDLKHTF